MTKIIEVSGLKKSFGTVHAVKGIDFYVEKGSLFAFLGANGAGKSTTIDMICTLLSPDNGEVTIDGLHLSKDDDKIRSQIGIVFQDSLLDPLLTVKENLELRGALYGMSKEALKKAMKRAAEITDINEFLKRPYGKLSGGQRRRADIARALINTPKILFLDEPTTGLDPQTRKIVWETIRRLQQETGMTVFLTTHYMEEAALADYITIMGKGEILAKGTPIELKQKYASDLLKLKPKERQELAAVLDKSKTEYQFTGEAFTIKLGSTLDALATIEQCKDLISNVEITNGTMDDVFLNIAGLEVESL